MESDFADSARKARLTDEHSPASDRRTSRGSTSAAIRLSSSTTTQDVDSTPCRPLTPRLLSRQQAAAYCNLSPSAFSAWVRAGRLPPPLAGTTRWDLKAIDTALDAMSGLQPKQETSALDEWRENRARRSERSS